jgi:NDP-sugar pyrophosphorylase family protein
MELFVLAGGLGTRLREVVSDVPKPMAPVDGEPFLSYVLRYWKKQGVSAFLISVGYLAEKIQGYYGNSFEGCSIRYMEEISPLGTGGAFMKMLREVMPTNPFLMVNGDTFFAVDLLSLKKCHHQNGAILTICAFNSIETDRYACINQNAEGKVLDFGLVGVVLQFAFLAFVAKVVFTTFLHYRHSLTFFALTVHVCFWELWLFIPLLFVVLWLCVCALMIRLRLNV